MNNLKQAIHETAQDLFNAGIINNERMLKYNKLNIPVIDEFEREKLKQLSQDTN